MLGKVTCISNSQLANMISKKPNKLYDQFPHTHPPMATEQSAWYISWATMICLGEKKNQILLDQYSRGTSGGSRI